MKNTGGSAFPMRNGDLEGMTLRDYLAGQALISMVREIDWTAHEVQIETRCEFAYEIADAMIKERGKE